MNTKSRISVPIELSSLPADDQIRPVPFNTIQIGEDGKSISGYVSFAALRKQAARYIAETLQYHHDLMENFYRWIIGCGDGTILYVSWHNGAWFYDIMGPGRKHASGVSGSWPDHKEAIKAAKSHAEEAYGGVAWDHSA